MADRVCASCRINPSSSSHPMPRFPHLGTLKLMVYAPYPSKWYSDHTAWRYLGQYYALIKLPKNLFVELLTHSCSWAHMREIISDCHLLLTSDSHKRADSYYTSLWLYSYSSLSRPNFHKSQNPMKKAMLAMATWPSTYSLVLGLLFDWFCVFFFRKETYRE